MGMGKKMPEGRAKNTAKAHPTGLGTGKTPMPPFKGGHLASLGSVRKRPKIQGDMAKHVKTRMQEEL